MKAVDPVTDTNYEQIGRITESFDMPDFVKEASITHWDELPRKAYAGHKMFPIHTKEATWLSSAYFLQNKDHLPEKTRALVGGRIKQAAKMWGIDFSELEKMASDPEPETPYLLSKELHGQKWQLFPVPDRESMKKAAEHLYANRARLPYEWRKEAASKLLDMASKKEMELPKENYLFKAAEQGVSNPKEVSHHLLLRAKMVDNEKVARTLQKLALQITEGPMEHSELKKCAKLAAKVDEHFRLNERYEDGLLTPEEAMFKLTVKDAQKAKSQFVELPNGRIIHESQIKKAAMQAISSAIGGEFEAIMGETIMPDFEDFKKAAKVLTEDDADTIVALMPKSEDNLGKWGFL